MRRVDRFVMMNLLSLLTATNKKMLTGNTAALMRLKRDKILRDPMCDPRAGPTGTSCPIIHPDKPTASRRMRQWRISLQDRGCVGILRVVAAFDIWPFSPISLKPLRAGTGSVAHI